MYGRDTEVFTIDDGSEECQREFTEHWEVMRDGLALAPRAGIVRRPPASRRGRPCFLALSSERSRREGKPLAQELQ